MDLQFTSAGQWEQGKQQYLCKKNQLFATLTKHYRHPTQPSIHHTHGLINSAVKATFILKQPYLDKTILREKEA